jgi:hypothetical protein
MNVGHTPADAAAGCPPEVVQKLARLARTASVSDFLAVLVAKRVREQLRQGSGNLTTR